jgi:hypothetical protein
MPKSASSVDRSTSVERYVKGWCLEEKTVAVPTALLNSGNESRFIVEINDAFRCAETSFV